MTAPTVGAMFRSAAALGVDAVLVTPHCADPLYRRSIRVSMGTVFQVPVDQHVVIPMAGGVDSLNVAAASAVVFWQRGAAVMGGTTASR